MSEPTVVQATWVGKCTSCGTGLAMRRTVEMRSVFGQAKPFDPDTFVPLGDKTRVACHSCGHPNPLRIVAGTVNPLVACTSQCTAATGPICICSCGGANHGSYYVPRKRT